MTKIKAIILNIYIKCFPFFLWIGSYIIPKRKNYYAFIPVVNKEFYGNVKALILYMKENNKEIDTILVGLKTKAVRDAKKKGLKAKTYYLSLWDLLRAEHLIVDTHRRKLFNKGRFSLVQLWHGSGFKNVGLLNDNDSEQHKQQIKKVYKKYNLVIATSASDKEKQNISFGTDKTIVTGYPRNDVFFEQPKNKQYLKVKYKLEKYNKIITYVPTYRDYETCSPFSNKFWSELQQWLEISNSAFIVKKHSRDKFLVPPTIYKNIIDLSSQVKDVQELLLITDLLISDYSSVSTDFVLTGNPIFIYAYDLSLYKENCRSLYYNLEAILPLPLIFNEKDLLNKIKSNNWLKDPLAVKSYNNFRNLFHKYLDGKSSKRVVDEIKKISNI